MSWEGMAGSGKNEEMNRLKIRMRSGQRTILEEVGTKGINPGYWERRGRDEDRCGCTRGQKQKPYKYL